MPRWLKLILLGVAVAIAVVILFTTVFPWIEQRLDDPTLGVLRLGGPARMLA